MQSKQKSPPRPRQRALSDQRLNSSGSVPTVGFLSRTKSTSVVPSKSKRATYSHPTRTATSPRVSLHDIITEEQESGAFVERRTSRFWSYIGNNHMAQNPELYSAEEIAQFAPRSHGHLRSPSVATDLDAHIDGGFTDHMWSPLEGKPSYVSLHYSPGDLNPS